MSKQLVSVVMSVYNGERYLAEQVQSILAQTHRELELIVRDDGSSDASAELARKLASKDARVRVMTGQKNVGLVANFLSALREAKGDFIAFSDQDDVWRADKIDVLLRVMGRDSGNMLAYSDMQICDENLRPLGRSFWRAAKILPRRGRMGEKAVLRNLIAGCSMLFRRDVSRAICEIAARPAFAAANRAASLDDTPFMHDHLAFVCASALGKIDYTRAKLVLYRQHAHNSIGAFYVPKALRRTMAEQLDRKLDLLAGEVWPSRGMNLDRLRDFRRTIGRATFADRLAYLGYRLYLRPDTIWDKAAGIARCILPLSGQG